MNNKRILFITSGTEITASSRTRVYNYKPFLENNRFNITIIPYNISLDVRYNVMNNKRPFIIKLINKINHLFKCIFYILIASRYDVIFIQRILLPRGVFGRIRTLADKIIFDFDDAIYLADRWKRSFLNRHKFLQRFQYIVSLSDQVIVSNEALKEIATAFNSNVIKLPTPVDTQKLTPKVEYHSNNKVLIGWIGSPSSSRYVEPLKETFELLSKKYPFLKLKLIGASPLFEWKIDMTIKQWLPEEEVSEIQSFDIGIMPLEEDEWSSAKAGYKLLQYMAVGIPVMASPIGVNKEIVEEGITGFVANSPDEWVKKLSILIEDKDLRRRMGKEGRRKAETNYSYEVNALKLIKILKDTLNRSRK